MDSIPENIRSVTRIADKDYNKWIHKRVILTTASQAGIIYSYIEFPSIFSHVFIDESAQGMEPETCIPISMIKEDGVVVLVGDHHQLGPVVMSSKAKQLELSLMERLMTDFGEYFKINGSYDSKYVVKLVRNYRSDPQIMAIPSQLFYDNQLLFEVKTDPNFITDMKLNSSVNFHGVIGLFLT